MLLANAAAELAEVARKDRQDLGPDVSGEIAQLVARAETIGRRDAEGRLVVTFGELFHDEVGPPTARRMGTFFIYFLSHPD